MKKINMFLVLLVFLNSCLGSKYKPLEIPEQLKTTKEIEEKYDFVKDWWKKYNDKNLDYLIDLALTNNKDYINAILNINKELYRLNRIKADLFPTLSGSLSTSIERDIYQHDTFHKTFSGELALNYEVDLFGRVRNIKDAFEFEYKATLVDLEAYKITLINSVVDLYYNILYINDAIKLAQDTVKNYNKMLEINNNKYNLETIDIAELKQIEQENLSAKNNLLNLQNQRSELIKSLKVILNVKPEFELKFSSAKNLLSVNNSTIETDVLISFLSNRLDIQANQLRLQKAFKNVSQANKQWWPTVKLNAVLSSSDSKASKTFEFGKIFGGISIDFPFLDWVRVKNDIKISKVEYQQQKLEFETSVNTALNERGYYNDLYENSINNFKNVNKQNNDQMKIMTVYKNRYNVGSIDLEELLKKMNDSNNSKSNLLQAKYQTVKYENMMYRAMGGRVVKKSNKYK